MCSHMRVTSKVVEMRIEDWNRHSVQMAEAWPQSIDDCQVHTFRTSNPNDANVHCVKIVNFFATEEIIIMYIFGKGKPHE